MGILPVVLAAALAASPAAAAGLPQLPPPTPRLETIERIDTSAGAVWTLREPDRGVGWFLGSAFVCRRSQRPRVIVYLGPFPPDRRPVQLVVRRPDGELVRFGRVIVAGPESGYNNVSLDAPAEQRSFVDAALRRGSLVSNGFHSFWNMASEAENAALAASLRDCGL